MVCNVDGVPGAVHSAAVLLTLTSVFNLWSNVPFSQPPSLFSGFHTLLRLKWFYCGTKFLKDQMNSSETRTGSIFNIYFPRMKRICFQCGKTPPRLCLWGVSRQSSLHKSYKSIINILKYEPNGHNRFTWRHIHGNLKQTGCVRNNYETMLNTYIFFLFFLLQNMSKNEFVCKMTNIKDLTIPELIWQELGGINKHFV